MMKLRFGEVQQLAQGHITSEWQSQDSNITCAFLKKLKPATVWLHITWKEKDKKIGRLL